ncbi:hypothetical protein Y1Q_0021498 [Alligator mississippiensis]|uniref:Uncharacterized protein n=1 Tax=Alligator mississippiensis TaxID=8496 RepID=A0A151PA42_ALLMI|nr:hypothetical protein Y1Q_0021498 [Alligator mississippiensis]
MTTCRHPGIQVGTGWHLDDNIHEDDPAHAEGLDPLFIIPGTQNEPHPPVAVDGMGPELVVNGLEVVTEHPIIHSILEGLTLIGYMKVSGPGQEH